MRRAVNDVKVNVRFKDTYGLEKFLYSSVHRVLAVETCDTKLELIRVFDICSECLDTKNISVLHWLHLKCFLNENEDVIATLSDLTIIDAFDCKTMDEEAKKTLQHLFESISNTLSKKVILIHGSNRLCFKCADFVKEYDTYFFKEKKITNICFEDLVEEAQQSFLNEHCICFRGNPMSLKEFLPCAGVKLNNIITSTVINKSIFNSKTDSLIEIGSPDIYNDDHYIKRKFHNEFVLSRRVKKLFLGKNIRPDLFIISGVENKVQLNAILKVPLKRTDRILDNNNILTFKNVEEARSYFDRQPSSRPTHFIKYNNDGLIWTASKGSLGCLPHYVYRNRASLVNEQELLLKKAVVLSGPLGTGKSTTLAARAYRAKSWIINIDMSDRKSIINRLPKIIDENNVVEFLSHWVEPHFLVNGLLHYYLFNSTESFVYILFDEFDQIADNLDCGSYTCFTRLLNFLKENSQAHVWITARPENSSELENALSEFSTEFRQMSLEEEQAMLGRNRLMPNLGDLPSFIGRPIVLKLLCDTVRTFEDVFTLVNKFIADKIDNYMDIYFKNNPNKRQIINYLYGVHEFAASRLLCLELAELLGNETVTLHVDIRRVGFVSSTANNCFQFVHSIFAQYFVSNMIYKWMQNPASCPMEELLFSKIFVRPQFRIIRFFLNHRIKTDTPHIGVKKGFVEYWKVRGNKRALHVLVDEGLFNIVQWFFGENDFSSCIVPLFATRYSLSKIKPLCKATFSITEVNEDESYKHVFLAIKTHQLEDVKRLLLNSTGDLLGLVYKSSSLDKNALHLAAKLGHKDIVEYLLEIGIPVDIVDNINATPLQYAAANGHLDIVKLLLSKGSNINQHDNHSKTAFFRSIEKGKFNVAQLLLKEDSLDVATVDKNGMTALEHAAKLGDKDIVQQLLLKGCNVNHRDHFGMNALAWAVTTGESEMVDFLMSSGASSDIRDWNGRNLIYIALKAKQWHLVPYLTFCLINVNVPDWNNVTPLEVAIVECKKWDVVEHLILEGACVANNGFDPISFAVEAGKPRIALLMVERGSCSIVSLPQELKETLLNELEAKAEATDDESLLWNLIKMGSVELLRYFIDKKGCAALSETYEELILSGVNLSEEMKSFVERKLVRLRSVTGQTLRLSKEDVDNRIRFVCEQIAQLKNKYLIENSEVDPQCIIRMRFIAQNIELLKRAVKDENIPWEQMELCLVIFMNFFVKPCNEDFIYRLVLDQEKLITYLDSFALYLKSDKNNSPSHWERLETDYRIMKDIYSLNRISYYIKLATDIDDYKGEVSTFVLMRCLQVIGESLKNTRTSQNLSDEVHDYLVFHAPENVKQILTKVRDHLSHSFSYKLKTSVENNLKSDPEYFQTIQNELKKIRLQTDFLLYTKKKEILEMYHRKCLELDDKSESLNQMNRYINWESHEQLIRDDYEIMDLKRIKISIQKLQRIIPDYKVILRELQTKVNNIEKSLYQRLDKAKSKYHNMRTNFTSIDEVQHVQCMQNLNINFCTNKKSGLYESAVTLLINVLESIQAKEHFETKIEVVSLCSQLLYLMKWDIHRVKIMQEIYRDLSEKPDKRSETNLDKLFIKLANALESEEDKNLFNSYFSNKKKLHLELEHLKRQPNTASIDQLNIPNKDKANLKKSLNQKKNQLFNNLIVNMDDYGKLFNNFNNDEKFHKVLANFCSSLKRSNISNVIDKFIDEENNNFQQIFLDKLGILMKIVRENKTNLKQNMSLQAASEILLLDVMEACKSKGALVEYDLSFDEFSPVLVGTALRNYLAHGTPLTDSLPFDPMNALISTVDILSENEANLFKPLAKPSPVSLSDSPKTFTKCFDTVAKQRYWTKKTMKHCKDDCFHEPAMSSRPFTLYRNFLEAASTGDLGAITRLIENISKQTLIKNNKPRIIMNVAIIWPAIVVASKNGHHNIVTSLLTFIDDNSHSHANPIMDPSFSKAIAKQLLQYEIETPFTTIPYDKNLLTTAFRLSAQSGHHDIVKILIDYGANVNATDKNHVSTLHLASEAGHELVVKTLLENDADVNAKTPDQITPLHMAAVKGYHKTAKVLTEFQAIIDAPRQKDLCTPLHIAAVRGHAKVTNVLLQHGADVNKLTIDHCTALHYAAQNNHINVAKILLQHNANVNTLDNKKVPPLHLAIVSGFKNMAEILLDNQARINYPDGELSPLHVCALYGQKEIIEMLLERHANTEALYTDKLTALHLASIAGDTEVAETLLRYKADVNATTDIGFTPLHFACQFGHSSVATALIIHKANIDVTDLYHSTPMHLAASHGHAEIIEYLLEEHAKMEAVNNFGRTPLHLSALRGHEGVAKVLLDHNCNIHAQSTEMATPLHYSASEGHENVVSLLLKYKAHVDAQDKNLFTPLHLAAQNGHENVAKLLIEHHANVNAFASELITPLHLAVQNGNEGSVRFLLTRGADVNAATKNGTTPILLAIKHKHEHIAELLNENQNKNI